MDMLKENEKLDPYFEITSQWVKAMQCLIGHQEKKIKEENGQMVCILLHKTIFDHI